MEPEMMSTCEPLHRAYGVNTVASNHDGRSKSRVDVPDRKRDPATATVRQGSESSEMSLSEWRVHRVYSISTMVSTDDGGSDSGLETFVSESSEGSDLPPPVSKGSLNHPHNCGPPCKYFWKASGCKDGANCTHCHVCSWDRKSMRAHASAMRCAQDGTDLVKMCHAVSPPEAAMTCAQDATDLVKMCDAVSPPEATNAQKKRRQPRRARRRPSASEGDAGNFCSGYMSPGEEFWY